MAGQRQHKMIPGIILSAMLLVTIWACHAAAPPTNRASMAGSALRQETYMPQQLTGGKRMQSSTKQLMLNSPAFEANQAIPTKATCDGKNISPPLHIAGVPSEAQSLALIVDDPDAPNGTFTHWLLWNIPAMTTEIEEGETPVGSVSGVNDFKQQGYGGPCPPSGTHHYRFKLYALDRGLNLPQNIRAQDLEKAMRGHILAENTLIGVYTRK